MWRLFERWLGAFPPVVGMLVDVGIMAVWLWPLGGGLRGRQGVLFAVVLVSFGWASYGMRRWARDRREAGASGGGSRGGGAGP